MSTKTKEGRVGKAALSSFPDSGTLTSYTLIFVFADNCFMVVFNMLLWQLSLIFLLHMTQRIIYIGLLLY